MKLKILSGSLVVIATLASATASMRTVACRVVMFSKNRENPAVLYAWANGSNSPAKVKPSLSVEAFPAEVAVPENGEIHFRADEKRASPVVAVAKIPPAVKGVFLFLMADDNPDDEILFQTVAIEDAPQGSQSGGIVVHNTSAHEGQVTLGSGVHSLPPGETLRVPTPADRDEYHMAPLKVELMKDGKWVALKEGMTRFSSRDLYLIFTYPGARPGETLIKTYQKSIAIPTSGNRS